jgi:hypothetical protein
LVDLTGQSRRKSPNRARTGRHAACCSAAQEVPMKKLSKKSLKLSPETIRTLTPSQLDAVAGGEATHGCSNNSCAHQVTGCKQN